MWLNVKWYDSNNVELPDQEIGAYGPIQVTDPRNPTGPKINIDTILNPDQAGLKIYEAHYGLTQAWASQLITLGYPADLALSYDRTTGAADFTLGQLAASPGTVHETFHFVLNNTVVKDDRIPPYGMAYDVAKVRNALPVPADQYGNPGPGGAYNYWDEVPFTAPAGATYATVDLLYQPTSWEYMQFLYLANSGQNAFLADEGANMLDAWLNTGMAAPYVMTSTVWGTAPVPADIPMVVDSLTTWSVSRQGTFTSPSSTFTVRDSVGIRANVVDYVSGQPGSPLSGAQVFLEVRDASGALVVSLQGFSDSVGNADVQWKTGRNQATGVYTATVVDVIKSGYAFDPAHGQTTVQFTLQ